MAVFLVSILLRILLAVVNREANDIHLNVIGYIQFEGTFVHAEDEWEGYHPKLYHATCAAMGRLFDLQSINAAIVAFQILSALAGVLTVYILLRLVQMLPIRDDVRLIVFAGAALNPKSVGINTQVTNDSFVILFGTLAIYSLWRLLHTKAGLYGALLVAAVILACLSKASGLVIFGGSVLVLVVVLFAGRSDLLARRIYLRTLLTLILLWAAIVPYFGQYYYGWKTHGNPIHSQVPTSIAPKFFEFVPDPTWRSSLGVTTLLDSWCTFRIIDLIRHPYNTLGVPIEPRHRSSLWSQLYGRTHFVHFDQFPLSWADRSRFVMGLGSAILGLALLHLFLMLVGFADGAVRAGKGVLDRGLAHLSQDFSWVMPLFLMLFAIGMLKFTYGNRDYSAMKAIYVFPAMPAFLWCFAEGCQWAVLRIAGSPRVMFCFYLWFMILIALYAVDVTYLISQLVGARLHS
ncbi:MAG: hypothetical protein AB1714_20215 [Acidobacteriota bacterium]